jgi:hypothetical protein
MEEKIVVALIQLHYPKTRIDTDFTPYGLDEPYWFLISEDPKGFDGGSTNLSMYASNNPILLVDPFGLDSLFFNGDNLYWFNDDGQMIRKYPATSGPFGKGKLPANIYKGDNLRKRTMKGMVCPSGGWSLDLTSNNSTKRSDLRIHPDQPPAGTKGCIGVNCNASGQLYNDLNKYFESGNSSIPVIVNYDLNPVENNYGSGGSYK